MVYLRLTGKSSRAEGNQNTYITFSASPFSFVGPSYVQHRQRITRMLTKFQMRCGYTFARTAESRVHSNVSFRSSRDHDFGAMNRINEKLASLIPNFILGLRQSKDVLIFNINVGGMMSYYYILYKPYSWSLNFCFALCPPSMSPKHTEV